MENGLERKDIEKVDVDNEEIEGRLQEKLAGYKALESRLDPLVRQQNLFSSKVLEIQSTIESIGEIEKKGSESVLFPLGAAAHVKGSVAEGEKIVVEVGAGVALEKRMDEAKKILEERRREMEEAVVALQKEIQGIASAMQRLESEAQQIVFKAQQERQRQHKRERQQGEGKFGVVSSE